MTRGKVCSERAIHIERDQEVGQAREALRMALRRF
jgi:hypothetical protein